MNIFQLLSICHNNYARNGKCPSCQNDDCKNGCSACLDDIHMNRIKRRYNCSNIVNCYVCKYQLKYSSEIFHLMNNHQAFSCLDNIIVWSIGCGPCPDLFGVANWMQLCNKTNLQYCGFDLNHYWQPVQNYINNISSQSPINIDVKFINNDIFSIYGYVTEWPDILPVNVLMMQYIISDIISNNTHENVCFFLKRTVDLIINRMPKNSFVVINDINHNTQARDYFEHLCSLLSGRKNLLFSRYHFVNNNRANYYQYGTQHLSNSLIGNIPDYCYTYNPWLFCSSAQLVIHKT